MVSQRDFLRMVGLGSQAVKENQNYFLKNIRITDNKRECDTITVAQSLVEDTDSFFDLMREVTDNKAFHEPIMFSLKTGRAQIDSPKWIEKPAENYLGVWIAATLEETLWAHYNFATNSNIASNVRKAELESIFENRSESL